MPDRNNAHSARSGKPSARSGKPSARSGKRRKWVIAGAIVFIGAWVIALTYSVTEGGRSPERLNTSDAAVAEQACLDAQRAMTALPAVGMHSGIEARATRVASEDAILTTMVGRIRALRPEGGAPETAMHAWLDDWERLVEAREHYAHDLRSLGVRARFVEPAAVGIQPVADKMNDWILEQGTRTDACNTGRLQAEVVEGPRIYGKESNS